jgi:hypothetical protein
MTGHYRLARLRISLLASTRIRRDRNPSPGLMAHCPKIKFARDHFSKLLYMCGFSHKRLALRARTQGFEPPGMDGAVCKAMMLRIVTTGAL